MVRERLATTRSLLHASLSNICSSLGCLYFRSLTQLKIQSDLSYLQPDDDSNDNDDDDEDENSIPLDDLPSTEEFLNRSPLKTTRLQRRQTIGAFQSSQHRSALRQLHAMFRPGREAYRSRLADDRIDEFEQIPMVKGNRTSTVEQSSGLRRKPSPTMD